MLTTSHIQAGKSRLIASPATRPSGVMGASYLDSLKTAGGTGVNSWSITAGALPQGLTLDGPSGAISGYPHQSGNFTYTATVTSGAQTQSKVFTMSVSGELISQRWRWVATRVHF